MIKMDKYTKFLYKRYKECISSGRTTYTFGYTSTGSRDRILEVLSLHGIRYNHNRFSGIITIFWDGSPPLLKS